MGKGAFSRMVPTVAVVDFLHHSLSFIYPKISQIWVRIEAGFLVQVSPRRVYLEAKC